MSLRGRGCFRRMDGNQKAAASGLVVNTCGWTTGVGYDLLRNTIRILRLDIVLVMEDDKLLHDLTQDFPDITVIKMKASGTPIHLLIYFTV